MSEVSSEKVKLEKLNMKAFLSGTFNRIRTTNKWYLLPLWLLLVAIAIVLFVSGHGYVLPAIYLAF